MPAAIPIAAGVIGLGATAGAAAAGVGKNTARATNFGKTDQYDRSKFMYGGTPGYAESASNRYQGLAAAAQGRAAAQADYRNANLSLKNANGMATLMAMRARGSVPSIAQMQADRQMQQAAASQASMAASARGPAALALAQQNAANNVANMQGSVSSQAQINAANERMQAEQAAFGAYGNLSAQQAQMAQYNAGLQQQQRGLNDQMTLGMTGNEMAVRQAQLQAGMQQQGLLAGSFGQQQAANMGVNQANAQREMQMFGMGLGAIQGAASMGMPPGKADGGPVEPGKPYVVGERGPELIVPRQASTVVPNEALPLMDHPDGRLLHVDAVGAYYAPALQEQTDGRPSLSGPALPPGLSPRPPTAAPAPASKPASKPPARRKMTPEEMLAWASAMISETQAKTDAALRQGPAVQATASVPPDLAGYGGLVR